MIKRIDSHTMGRSEKGWLHSLFHFSFAEYFNPQNMHFGVLRVVNDDLVEPGTGFDTHPHEDMEIVSYVVDGVLTHQDSMGNKRELTRGQVQYMSAGTGVFHSEHKQHGRQAYLIQIEGTGLVNGEMLTERDAAEITKEDEITLQATTLSHVILFDMKH